MDEVETANQYSSLHADSTNHMSMSSSPFYRNYQPTGYSCCEAVSGYTNSGTSHSTCVGQVPVTGIGTASTAATGSISSSTIVPCDTYPALSSLSNSCTSSPPSFMADCSPGSGRVSVNNCLDSPLDTQPADISIGAPPTNVSSSTNDESALSIDEQNVTPVGESLDSCKSATADSSLSIEDPYSFVEDSLTNTEKLNNLAFHFAKKRGRKPKKLLEAMAAAGMDIKKYRSVFRSMDSSKPRRRRDRFNGLPEEELFKLTLPDYLSDNLDIVFVGMNPGLVSAYRGHYFTGPGDHFWRCLYLSGIITEPLTSQDDSKMQKWKIGFTNIVSRTTRTTQELTRKEIRDGCRRLLDNLQKYKPKMVVFNGKVIFESFSGKKEFLFGKQPTNIEETNTKMWVMPSSSARSAQLPQAQDKVPHFAALKRFRDYLIGDIDEISDSEVVFDLPLSKRGNTAAAAKSTTTSSSSAVESTTCTVSQSAAPEVSAVDTADTSVSTKKKRGRPKKTLLDADGRPIVEPSKGAKDSMDDLDECLLGKKRGRPRKNRSFDLSVPFNGARAFIPGVYDMSSECGDVLPSCPCPPTVTSGIMAAGFRSDFPYNFHPASSMNHASMSCPTVDMHMNQIAAQQFYTQQFARAALAGYGTPNPHYTMQSNGTRPLAATSLPSVSDFNKGHIVSPGASRPPIIPSPVVSPANPMDQTSFEAPPSLLSKDTSLDSPPVPTLDSSNRHGHFSSSSSSCSSANSMFASPGQAVPIDFSQQKSGASIDLSAKSLSGLESLVDQIPSIQQQSEGHSPDAADAFSSTGPSPDTFPFQPEDGATDRAMHSAMYYNVSSAPPPHAQQPGCSNFSALSLASSSVGLHGASEAAHSDETGQSQPLLASMTQYPVAAAAALYASQYCGPAVTSQSAVHHHMSQQHQPLAPSRGMGSHGATPISHLQYAGQPPQSMQHQEPSHHHGHHHQLPAYDFASLSHHLSQQQQSAVNHGLLCQQQQQSPYVSHHSQQSNLTADEASAEQVAAAATAAFMQQTHAAVAANSAVPYTSLVHDQSPAQSQQHVFDRWKYEHQQHQQQLNSAHNHHMEMRFSGTGF